MNFLFIFLDGVGLGVDDPQVNPFSTAQMPALQALLGGRKLVAEVLRDGNGRKELSTGRATLLALDANLGVAGLPQSATGQATLLTGINVPAAIGYHYGPKPNAAVAEYVKNGNLFSTARKNGWETALLNAYPPRYFTGIASGRRLYSAIPLAASSAGLSLKTTADLYAGQALSADFTGAGWRERLGFPTAPLLEPAEAGKLLAQLGQLYRFSFFEYWLSDYAGHKQDFAAARSLLETFDQVLGGLLAGWDDKLGLILITSDHGNLEDLTTRRHTSSPVPGLVIGAPHLRQAFCESLHDLTGVAPAIRRALQ